MTEGESVNDTKQMIEDIIREIRDGETEILEAWERIANLKDLYVKQHSQQSWNTFIGNKFQEAVLINLKSCFARLKKREPQIKNLEVFTESQLKGNSILKRKLSVEYGEYLLLPDTDMAIVYYNFADPWKSHVLAIISCKTSLRERIAQACYWKLKLLSSEVTKDTHVILATTDNDQDFFIVEKSDRYAGKHRNRVIAEHELDGIYILRRDFKQEWESSKVRLYDKIVDDILEDFRNA